MRGIVTLLTRSLVHVRRPFVGVRVVTGLHGLIISKAEKWRRYGPAARKAAVHEGLRREGREERREEKETNGKEARYRPAAKQTG